MLAFNILFVDIKIRFMKDKQNDVPSTYTLFEMDWKFNRLVSMYGCIYSHLMVYIVPFKNEQETSISLQNICRRINLKPQYTIKNLEKHKRFTWNLCGVKLMMASNIYWNISVSGAVVLVKGTVSSQSEKTFNRAWNRCPSLRWTQWLIMTGSFMQQQRQYDLIKRGIICSHWVNLKLAPRFHALLIVTILSL